MPLLVVQMGHSGRPNSLSTATGAPGEKDFTERVGAACSRLLSGRGWDIRIIDADEPSSLYRGNAFVAVHADGNNNPSVQGASVGYQTSEGNSLAQAWRAAYVKRGWKGPWHKDNYTTNLGQYYGVSTAVAQSNRRACIIECGTITNPAERTAMTSQEGIDRVALAIGDAVGIQHGKDNDMQPSDQSLTPKLDANGSVVGYYTWGEIWYWDNQYANQTRLIVDRLLAGQEAILKAIAEGEASDLTVQDVERILSEGVLTVEVKYPPVGTDVKGEQQLAQSMLAHPAYPDDEESVHAIIAGQMLPATTD